MENNKEKFMKLAYVDIDQKTIERAQKRISDRKSLIEGSRCTGRTTKIAELALVSLKSNGVIEVPTIQKSEEYDEFGDYPKHDLFKDHWFTTQGQRELFNLIIKFCVQEGLMIKVYPNEQIIKLIK